ncbi:hypothetical protein BpHYR1_012958 [Brachionus plicatilis]|uniref:Uncharacterized protein n=1 Tax=Brachionus plicatilis TaxID=10195 RepID=A0A3M7RBR2_BRAPC|nr:hypothetical protein BpHYR1_012958 [Brachionus plicatilis]
MANELQLILMKWLLFGMESQFLFQFNILIAKCHHQNSRSDPPSLSTSSVSVHVIIYRVAIHPFI